ncbi:MAG: DUF739 family protein [Clostridia bacterium]
MELEFDYSKLLGRIKEKLDKQEKLAEKMGLSQVSLNKKLNNLVQFTQKDIMSIIVILEIPVEEIPLYFFTQKVKKS